MQVPLVLVVERNEATLNIFPRLLGSPFQVLLASNAVTAVRLLSERPVDVLLTDLSLPDLDGFAFIQAARKKNPDLKIVAMVEDGRVMSQEDCAAAARVVGAQKVIAKPFTAPALRSVVFEVAGITAPEPEDVAPIAKGIPG